MKARHPVQRFMAVIVALLVLGGVFITWQLRHVASLPAQPAAAAGAAAVLTASIPDGTTNAETLRRGQYLVREGDCLSCHLKPGGEPFAGGLGLNTPFGVIYSSNISSDVKTGIGRWTGDQFYAAMHDGQGPNGNLYPAFPYPWFSHTTRADTDAILAFLKTTLPVDYTPPANLLPFPFNVRATLAGWDILFLRPAVYHPDAKQSGEWNRGAELVSGLGHCSACHTARNAFGADRSEVAFEGGVLEGFVAPDLTGNQNRGLGRWTVDDIAEYLETGRNAYASAGGQMGDVITYSTSLLTAADRRAIAVYLKALPSSAQASANPPDGPTMNRGAAIYSDVCSACHLEKGVGQPRYFPPLSNNAVVQQTDPSSVIHLVLAGGRVGPSPTRPSPLTMPSFAWKLTDQEIADVGTYIRNSWGNRASAIGATEVKRQREALGLGQDKLTENSGDR